MANPKFLILGVSVAFAALTAGSASANNVGTEDAALQQALRESQARIAALEQQATAPIQLASASSVLPAVSAAAQSAPGQYNQIPGGELLPPAANPGECYARVLIPPSYENRTEQLLKSEASTRVETIPAQYETITQDVLVKEATSQLVTVPARYETATERVLVENGRSYWTLGKGRKATGEADASLIEEASRLGLDLANAAPGTCYSERLIPARFETRTEQVLVAEASSSVSIIPATYENVDERVLTSEASSRIVEVPAVYETQSERILVKPATTIWKKGKGAIERVNNTTGEIMCLVEVPAEYRTVTKRVLVTPASSRTVDIPAEYKTVKVRRQATSPQERRTDIPAKYKTVTKRDKVSDARRLWALENSGAEGAFTGRQLCRAEVPARYETVTRRVVATPATTKQVPVPAEYRTVKVKKVVVPATTRTIDIPAEYSTVTKRVQVSDGSLAWKQILCETNTTPNVVRDLQRALQSAGHNPGSIDGVLGGGTLRAVDAYQRAKGLPTGGITMATLKSLGVR